MVKITKDHDYNDPNISPKDFMLAVMRDPSVPLSLRMDAANNVAPYEHAMAPHIQPQVHLTLRIEGGLTTQLPGEQPLIEQRDGVGPARLNYAQ
jgi:hypothetical protein